MAEDDHPQRQQCHQRDRSHRGQFERRLLASPIPPQRINNPVYARSVSQATLRLGPSIRWHSHMAKLLPVRPAGSTSGSVTFGTPLQQNFNEYIARFDQVFRGQDRLFGRFYLNSYHHAPTYDGKNLLTAGPGSTVQTQNWAVGYTWVISPTAGEHHHSRCCALGLRSRPAGRPGRHSSGYDRPSAQASGNCPRRRAASATSLSPATLPSAASPMPNSSATPATLREMLSWNKGKHDVQLRLRSRTGSVEHPQHRSGEWQLQLYQRRDWPGAWRAFCWAISTQFSQTSGDYSDSRENPMGFFANDKWKISPRLTLDYGLRWEPQQVMKEIWGRIEQFRPDA